MKSSKGEEKIIQLLKEAGLKFEREKKFKDLKCGKFRFDFYVEVAVGYKIVIEVQGMQHYKPVAKFHKTPTDFKAGQERDRRKIGYCLAHNIPIYCIPYWELNNLHSITDVLQPKFRATDRWKNDKDWQKFQAAQKFDKPSFKLL